MELTTTQQLALATAIKGSVVSKLKKEMEESTKVEVDLIAHVKGILSKNSNVEKRVPASLPQIDMLVDSLDIMAELVSAMSAETADAFLGRLAERQNRAIDENRKREIEGKVTKAFLKRFVNGQRQPMDAERKEAFQATWDAIADTTIKTTNGAVTFKGEVEAIEPTANPGE